HLTTPRILLVLLLGAAVQFSSPSSRGVQRALLRSNPVLCPVSRMRRRRLVTPVDVARGLRATTSERPDRTAPPLCSDRCCLFEARCRADHAEDHRGGFAGWC